VEMNSKKIAEDELNAVEVKNSLQKIKFGDLKNHESPAKEKSLDLTDITFGGIEIHLGESKTVCQENQAKFDGAKDSGDANFSTKLKLTIKETDIDDAVIIEDLITFIVDAKDIQLIKEFNYDKQAEKPSVNGYLRLEFAFKSVKLPEDKRLDEHKAFIEQAINEHFKNNKYYESMSAEIDNDMTAYYEEVSKKMVIPTIDVAANLNHGPTYKLDLNYVSEAKPLEVETSNQCGLYFLVSGFYEEMKDQEEWSTNFESFDLGYQRGQFLHTSVITDLIRDSTKKFDVWGELKEIDLTNAPFAITMPYLIKMLPDLSRSYSLGDAINIKYAIYDVKLTFKADKEITGTAKLDATFYKQTAPIKQIMSFDATVSFSVKTSLTDTGLNFIFYNVAIVDNKVNVRDHVGRLRYDVFYSYLQILLRIKFENNPHAKLFKQDLQLGFKNVKYFELGILLY